MQMHHLHAHAQCCVHVELSFYYYQQAEKYSVCAAEQAGSPTNRRRETC
jgi:hypothetical protein